jgi:hypothetical protein
MSTSDSSLPAHWQYYAERAHEAHHGRVDAFAYGREELLWATLAVIESGSPFTDECRQRLNRLPWNRAKKYRRLRGRLMSRRTVASAQDLTAVDVANADAVEQVRGMLSANEWKIECRLAAGQTYAEVALDCGLSPDTLKVRASRWRARIRKVMVKADD